MNKYDLIVEELQNRVDSGDITLEFAEAVNDLAYDKYVTESSKHSLSKDECNQVKQYISTIKNSMKKFINNSNNKSICEECVDTMKKTNNELKKFIISIDDFSSSKLYNNKQITNLLVSIGTLLGTISAGKVAAIIDIKKNDKKGLEAVHTVNKYDMDSFYVSLGVITGSFINAKITDTRTKEGYIKYCKKIDDIIYEYESHIKHLS